MSGFGWVGRLALGGFVGAMATAAGAEEISVSCANELVRRESIAASDYAQKNPPWLYWVYHQNQNLGPWSILEIKRRMHLGELPANVYAYSVNSADGWKWSSEMKEFNPLPGDRALTSDQVRTGLKPIITGCWVSDPFSEAAGEQTVWLLMLFDNGVFFPSRGTVKAATSDEGFWFSRTSNAPWGVSGQNGADFRLSLPDMTFFDPTDDFPARMLDRNTMVVTMPGTGGLTFRRM